MKSALSTGALVALFLRAVPCGAGIADSPLPVLVLGQPTFHLYSVPGLVATGSLQTFFSCTSTDTATMQVGVEIFGPGGGAPFNDAAATSVNLPPGQTKILATSTAVAFPVSSNVGGTLSTGSARILATSKKLACTAFVVDPANDPPAVAWQLTIIAKLKQKAAN